MKSKKKIKIKEKTYLLNDDYNNLKKERKNNGKCLKYFFIIIYICTFIFYIYNLIFPKIKKNPKPEPNKKFYFDKYEVNVYDLIKNKLRQECTDMWVNQREFLNGVIRKFKPKKIVEVGCGLGGSSIVMLNAIDDFKDSKLYSIDLDLGDQVGQCVHKDFPNLLKKWTLFKGKIATEYIEQIGNNIDLAFFDTSHVEPGEILDFLMVLPFLKENAVVIFHDIAIQITHSQDRSEWSPYLIFNGIRGEKFLPSGNYILKQDIGAIILDSNQKKYYKEYFRLLGGQWYYFPKEEHIDQLRTFFKKYYEKDCKDCLLIFEEAVAFNREFVKRNPKPKRYDFYSD